MEKVTENVYWQRYTAGVVGVLNTPHGLVCIDAPLLMEESRLWRGDLMRLRGGSERLVVLLDTNPDRALGIRNMDMPVISHELAMQALSGRPVTYRSEGHTGTYADTAEMSGAYRWPLVDLSFSAEMELNWAEGKPIQLLHRPGPRPESIWVVWEEARVVFVGDAVLQAEPPFLATADLSLWIDSLNDLLTDRFKRFAIIGGRDGLLRRADVRNHLNRLERLRAMVDELKAQPDDDEALRAQVDRLLKKYHPADEKQKRFFADRLYYGLKMYLKRRM